MFREHLPPLEQILEKHRRLLFLGEPGMGLSSLARQIQSHLTSKSASKAVLATLEDFESNLPAVLPRPASGTPGENVAGSAGWYLLDDLDRVDFSHLGRLITELNRLESSDPNCHIALFSKQGYAAANFAPFDVGFSRYYILGLASADVQKACEAEGIDPLRFDEELERLDTSVEAGNPAVLRTLTSLYSGHARLPDTRTAVFAEILQELPSPTSIAGSTRQECLRALGLAMELASRNFLTPAEAELAIGARLELTPQEATALLRQVAPVLLFTPEGISFPHRSFGEFFAACALRDRRLSLVLDAIFFPGTRIPNPSWKPALGFLAEMHSGVRRYLAAHHPELALAASLSVLTGYERAAIARSLYARLRYRKEPRGCVDGHRTSASS
jgi:hypothetical protein